MSGWSAAAASWAELMTRACWQGALVIVLVAFACRLLRLSPAVRSILWLAACARLVVSLLWFSPPTLKALPSDMVAVRPAQSVPLYPEAIPTSSHQSAADLPTAENVATGPLHGAGGPGAFEAAQPAASWSSILCALWLGGVAIALCYCSCRAIRLAQIIRHARVVEDQAVERIAAQVALQTGLASAPELCVSEKVRGPMAAWAGRSVILLPGSAVHGLPPHELRMAIAHEAAHIRRADCWTALIAALAQALFFFFPPAWYAVREYAIAREQACDAEAIRLCNAAPSAYGLFLLRFVTAASAGVAALNITPCYRTLERRMRMLSNLPLTGPRWWAIPTAALAGAAALIPIRLAAQDSAPAAKAAPTLQAAPVQPAKEATAQAANPSQPVAPAAVQAAPRTATAAQARGAARRRGRGLPTPVAPQIAAEGVPTTPAVADPTQGVPLTPTAPAAEAGPARGLALPGAAPQARNFGPTATAPVVGLPTPAAHGVEAPMAPSNFGPDAPAIGPTMALPGSRGRRRSADDLAVAQSPDLVRGNSGQISVRFNGANLLTALEELFRHADADYKIDQDAAQVASETRVYMQLRSVSLRKALEILLSGNHAGGARLTYRIDGGVYLIQTSDGSRRGARPSVAKPMSGAALDTFARPAPTAGTVPAEPAGP